MPQGGKIYFASDLHLGTPDFKSSAAREKLFVQWLDEIKADAAEVFIIGDVFDFWHEYKTVVPRGFVRLQGKLAELCDAGIPVHIFTGNHDLWMFGYFEQELGAKVYTQPIQRTFNGKRFYIGHGDGLGPGDHGYKFIKKVFSNPVCQFLFRWLHPDIGTRIATYFSYESRFGNEGKKKAAEAYTDESREWLVQFCKETLKTGHYDFFVFGHRHLALDIKVGENSRYINTGDWLDFYSYAVYDGTNMELKYYKKSTEPGT